jgi:hypothetical protein
MTDRHGPFAQAYRLYVKFETRASSALESLGTNALGELLATSASNALEIAKLPNGSIDRGIRAMRVAGRADITDLSRQLARMEDKLERILQLVEELEGRPAPARPGGRAASNESAARSSGARTIRARATSAPAAKRPTS